MTNKNNFKDYIRRATITLLLAVMTATTAWAGKVVSIEVCEGGAGFIHLKGWAYDPNNTSTSIDIGIAIFTNEACTSPYGLAHNLTANIPRTDIAEPGNHGFEVSYSATPGKYWLYIIDYATEEGYVPLGDILTATVTAMPSQAGTITITSETDAIIVGDGTTLTGTGGVNTHIMIADGATVTLNGLDISNENWGGENQSGISCFGDATIILAKGTTNYIRGGRYTDPCIKAGPKNSTLTIKGYGTLVLRSYGLGACIGGCLRTDCGNIVIEGGTLDLNTSYINGDGTSSGHAACIGSGRFAECGNITISGGNINAIANFGAAAIGSGRDATCGNINITGGTIYAATESSQGGAAIGGGLDGICGNISISGITSVSAEKHSESTPYCIGPGGGSGTCGTLTLWGQTSNYIVGQPYVFGPEVLAPTDVPYTVRFNANGGTGSMADQSFYSNTPQALTANGFSLSGKAFKCWSTKANGSGYDCYNGETVTNLGNVTLYAQWANTDYVVSFDPNGGTGTMAGQNFAMNTTQVLNANIFTRTGYDFMGWNTESGGSGTSYADKQAVSNLGSITLYAQWSPCVYNITYLNAVETSDYVNNPNPTTYTYMGGAITLADPSRLGYTFDGWTYGEVTVPTKSVTIAQGTYGDLTFTAHWTTSSDVNITENTGYYQLQDGQTLSGTGGANAHITIADRATVTLSGVSITGHTNQWWSGITCEGDATIILDEGTTNTVAGGSGWSGIFVPQNKTLTIQGSGTLIANGSSVIGYSAAGIGGGGMTSASCGNIVITGGIITATGGKGTPGIGGGRDNTCGNISITGGTVTANGGDYAPGIGGSSYHSCGNITITNGVTSVTATKGTGSPYSVGAAKYGTSGTIIIGGVEMGGIPQSPFTYNPLDTTPYTVTFNANGGEGTMDNETFTANTLQALTTNAFTRWSYDFTGWNTKADGSGVSFADGQKVINLGTATLYAQWQWVDLGEPDSPFGLLIKDETEAMGTAARWYINMPTSGTITQTFSDARITTFKVYDNGGKNGNYSSNCNGYLVLNAPNGYVLQLSGMICTIGLHMHGSDRGNDYLSVYDNNLASGAPLLNHVYGNDDSWWENISSVTSSGKSMTLYFHSNGSYEASGMDLTVTLIKTMEILELADDADNSTAISGADGELSCVTLTGRTLFKDGDWNTLCLPFNLGNATATDNHHFDGTLLEGATVMELNGDESNLTSGTLTLNFKDAKSIEPGKPYIVKWAPALTISTDAEWETFASNVNNGTEEYAGKLVKLGDNINVSTMVGTNEHPFKGTFDGDGHTLKLSISDEYNQGTAPFRYISGATIMNVKTIGTVTGNLHCAGLVGFAKDGTNIIKNCEVAASIVCSGGSHSHCGGILGHGLSSSTTISNCLFSGSITGATTATGIIYGWGDNGTHTIENCYANGTYSGGDPDLMKGGDTKTANNCYKNLESGSYGTHTTATGDDLVTQLGSGWKNDGGNVVPKKYVQPDIVNPVFTGVTIDATAPKAVTFAGGSFVGQYDLFEINAGNLNEIILLGSNNTLGYSSEPRILHPFRAHFEVPVGNGGGVKAYQISFGDEGTETGIISIDNGKLTMDNGACAWYDMSGRKLGGKPTQKGIYIHNGIKGVIK